MKKQFKVLIFVFLIPILGFSTPNDLGFSKQKNIKKAYFVNPDAGLDIENSYGNVTVSTWEEDKIELDITIKVSGNNENWVNQKLNDMGVDILALKNKVSAKTFFSNSGNYNNENDNSFEVNYIIRIPKNGNVKILNKYGNIISGDILGSTNFTCKYGKITLGKLNGNKNEIEIEYCPNSSINFVKNASIIAKYSQLKINEAANVTLSSDYTDVSIDEILNIFYQSKYGSLKFQKAGIIEGNGNYLTLKIGEILNNLKINTKYSSINIGIINSNANNVNIVSSYSGINIGYQSNYFFNFDVVVKFASFKYDNDLQMSNKEETNNSKTYNGFYKKKGLNNVTINSNYGNVTLSRKQ